MHNWTGKKHTEETKRKMSLVQRSENNANWKGDKVGYKSLHEWVRRYLPKPKLCKDCKLVKPFEVANISQKYKRDLVDWEWLCRKCHINKDGRHRRMMKLLKKALKKLKDRICGYCNKKYKPQMFTQKYCSKSCREKFDYYQSNGEPSE